MKKTDGFTLVELMVGILAVSLVSGAIMTFLLMGMRTNHAVIDANTNQRNAKIVFSLLENLASEGSISTLKVNGELTPDPNSDEGLLIDAGLRSWYLYGASKSDVLLSYSPSEKRLYTNDTVLMEGVQASALTLSKAPLGGYLIGFTLQTEDSTYQTSVYNRLTNLTTEGIILDQNNSAILDFDRPDEPSLKIPVTDTTGRALFLETLLSQYGSTGTIISNGISTNIPYSLWYCNGKYWPDWNENTPWCAIFVSWAAAQVGSHLSEIPHEANVDNLWNSVARINSFYFSEATRPGNLIFFNWDDDPTLEHVGVVLFTEGDYIYTIEGNSGGQVALRRYSIDDPDIHSYASLAWT